MTRLICFFLSVFALTAVLPFPVSAQDSTRQEVIVRLRDENGTPFINVSISLIRVYDSAPMGTRATDASGSASWTLPTGYEYEFVLPDDFRLTEDMVNEVGDMGFGNLGFRLGKAGTQSLPSPVVIGLVLATTGEGENLFWDKTPNEAIPQPDIPLPGHDHHDNDEDNEPLAAVLLPVDETGPPNATNDKQPSGVSAWIVIASILFIAAIGAGYLWLRPVLKGGVT